MGILIGMDEAGYGPNFGPLVVTATAWEVADEGAGIRAHGTRARIDSLNGNGALASATAPDPAGTTMCDEPGKTPGLYDVDLYRLLRPVVAKSASERRIAIADSKALYHPGLGLRQLERGVHAVLLALGQSHRCWSALIEYCRADPDGHHRRHCWPDGHNSTLPIDSTSGELTRLGVRFQRACESASVRPLLVRARFVYPAQFNDLVACYGSKGAALSHVTVGLLREVVDFVCPVAGATSPGDEKGTGTDQQAPLHASMPNGVGASPLYAVCDKHGGRNFYTALLQHHFSERWVEAVFESHPESRYEWGPPESRTCVAFRMNGERFLPTALASMTAKYLRELAMRAFNEFWCARVPSLKPTAGYPMDSRRYKKAIESVQRELGIDDHVLWRSR